MLKPGLTSTREGRRRPDDTQVSSSRAATSHEVLKREPPVNELSGDGIGDPAHPASDGVAVPNGAQPATESRVETRSIRSRRIRTPHRRSVALAAGSSPEV